jgi:hypothetical protein
VHYDVSMSRFPSAVVSWGKNVEFELELSPDNLVWVSREQVHLGVLVWDSKRRRIQSGRGVLPEPLVAVASVSLRVARLAHALKPQRRGLHKRRPLCSFS